MKDVDQNGGNMKRLGLFLMTSLGVFWPMTVFADVCIGDTCGPGGCWLAAATDVSGFTGIALVGTSVGIMLSLKRPKK